MGVVMPSVDAADRHFPLTVAAVLPVASAPMLFNLAASAESWFQDLEACRALCPRPADRPRPAKCDHRCSWRPVARRRGRGHQAGRVCRPRRAVAGCTARWRMKIRLRWRAMSTPCFSTVWRARCWAHIVCGGRQAPTTSRRPCACTPVCLPLPLRLAAERACGGRGRDGRDGNASRCGRRSVTSCLLPLHLQAALSVMLPVRSVNEAAFLEAPISAYTSASPGGLIMALVSAGLVPGCGDR